MSLPAQVLLNRLLFADSLLDRPAKKRCQFRVVYNMPSTTPSDPNAQPEMTANPPTQCPSAALRLAGDCPHCQRVFCSTHRTPEAHNCTGMQACREAAFQANKERLEREKTVSSKIAST
nr:nuclear protein [Cryptococcus depauperatus CBS 7855]